MKVVINILLVIAILSLIAGIISRLTLIPLPIAPGAGIEARSLLAFTNTCLLIAIALMLLQISKSK